MTRRHASRTALIQEEDNGGGSEEVRGCSLSRHLSNGARKDPPRYRSWDGDLVLLQLPIEGRTAQADHLRCRRNVVVGAQQNASTRRSRHYWLTWNL